MLEASIAGAADQARPDGRKTPRSGGAYATDPAYFLSGVFLL